MIDKQQPSFSPNEYVHRWLTEADQAISARPDPDVSGLDTEEHHEHHSYKRRKHLYHHHEQNHRSELPKRHRKKLPSQLDIEASSTKQQIQAHPGTRNVKEHLTRGPRDTDRAASPMSAASEARLGDSGDSNVPHSLLPEEVNHPDPNLQYARRPRRRTKLDKYEYKGHEQEKQSCGKATHDRRSSRRQSGADLVQNFKAPNVEPERLTLKQNQNPGIFGKGRASAPIHRRGLPDLTFSEMTFLNKKRDLVDVRYQGLHDHNAARKNRAAAGNGISKYFMTPSDDPSGSRLKSTAATSDARAESSPAKLLGQPAYDEDSARTKSNRTKFLRSPLTIHNSQKWNADPTVPGVDHYQPVHGVARSSSYVSWSQSPDRRDLDEKLAAQHTSSRVLHDVGTTIHPRNSASNPAHTPRLGNGGHLRHNTGFRRYYSLEDLKCLAAKVSRQEQSGNELGVSSKDRGLSAAFDHRVRTNHDCERGNYFADDQKEDQTLVSAQKPFEETPRILQNLEAVNGTAGFVLEKPMNMGCQPYGLPTPNVLMPPQSRIDPNDIGLLNSISRNPVLFLSSLDMPICQLWQHRRPETNLESVQSRGQDHLQSGDIQPAVAQNLNERNQYFEIAASEVKEAHRRDIDRLDSFDSALLRSAAVLQDQSGPDVMFPEENYTEDFEGDMALPYDHKLVSEYDETIRGSCRMHAGAMLETESSMRTYPRLLETAQQRRPRLLRPSEHEAAFPPEPFTGFSQPWMLY